MPLDGLRQAVFAQAPVGKAGEPVEVGQLAEVLFLVHEFQGQRRVAGKLEQQSNLLFIEISRLAGVQLEYRLGLALHHDRKCPARAEVDLRQEVPPRRNVRIIEPAIVDHVPLFAQGD